MGGQEVHEAAIVAGGHPEARQQRLVAAPRLAQAAPHELAQIVARRSRASGRRFRTGVEPEVAACRVRDYCIAPPGQSCRRERYRYPPAL